MICMMGTDYQNTKISQSGEGIRENTENNPFEVKSYKNCLKLSPAKNSIYRTLDKLKPDKNENLMKY